MAVNGIVIRVGQKWRRRDGGVVTVVTTKHSGRSPHARFPVSTDGGAAYTTGGRYSSDPKNVSPYDLVELIEDAPTAAAPTKGVNGVEIKGGQKWLRRDGTEVKIAAAWDSDVMYPVVDTKGERYTKKGEYEKELAPKPHAFDLVELIEAAPSAAAPTATLPAPASAPGLLEAAAGHMHDRAAAYDKPEGERSMAQTVAIFNLHHGAALTEAQGWHFMQILKDVRLFTDVDQPHRDSGEDGIAYSALKVEALLKGGAQ